MDIRNCLQSMDSDKLNSCVEYVCRFSIYPYSIMNDYNTAQCYLASMFYFLINGDVEEFFSIQVMSERWAQMKSTHIKDWLLEDFQFKRRDVMRALNTYARLVHSQSNHSNSPLFADLMTRLELKYNLEGYLLKIVLELTEHSSTNKNADATGSIDEEQQTFEGWTNSHYATKSIATQTLIYGIPPIKVDSDILEIAVHNNSTAVMSMFLSQEVTDEGKGHALLTAAEVGYSNMVSLLVSSGANIGYKNDDGDSSLILAAYRGHLECVKVLLDSAGVDVNIRGFRNSTPLICASHKGHTEIVKLLLNNGADPNMIDCNEDTPLHHVAYHGHVSATEVLLNSAADPNAKNNDNTTPLHYAAKEGNCCSLADLLISSGADVNAINNKGHTPLDIAVLTNNKALTNLLRS